MRSYSPLSVWVLLLLPPQRASPAARCLVLQGPARGFQQLLEVKKVLLYYAIFLCKPSIVIKEKNIIVVGGSKDLFLVLFLWDYFSAASPGIHKVWNIIGWGAKFGSFKHKNLLKIFSSSHGVTSL